MTDVYLYKAFQYLGDLFFVEKRTKPVKVLPDCRGEPQLKNISYQSVMISSNIGVDNTVNPISFQFIDLILARKYFDRQLGSLQ